MGDPRDIDMLVTVKLAAGRAAMLPNLRLVQKLGAGVDSMVRDPNLPPQVRITRLKPDAPAREIAEYVLAYVLREQRHLTIHAENQAAATWRPLAPKQAPETTVGVLGLGHIGSRVARCFAGLDYRVLGWSRSAKTIQGVTCRYGDAALLPLLGECDYVASILPATDATRDLFDEKAFAAMKPGAFLINAGRGDLIVEQDLLAALDRGELGGAVLDVFRQEPLPADHAFWRHPKITVTPHVSGWHLTGVPEVVAENYRRLQAGQPLINEVDRARGY